MQCSCGGQTKPGRAERSKQAVVLEFQTCHTCGRVQFDALRRDGALVAVGLDAQRAFAALDQSSAPASEPAHDPAKNSGPWFDALEHKPQGGMLVCVEYLTGGNYIAHASFFDRVWDLIGRWRRHDNSQALREAREAMARSLAERPPGLHTPEWLLQPEKPAAQPALPRAPGLPPAPVVDLPPVGGNFSLF